jgi:hypothetical protein
MLNVGIDAGLLCVYAYLDGIIDCPAETVKKLNQEKRQMKAPFNGDENIQQANCRRSHF